MKRKYLGVAAHFTAVARAAAELMDHLTRLNTAAACGTDMLPQSPEDGPLTIGTSLESQLISRLSERRQKADTA